MDQPPPPLPSRATRFQGWLRVGLFVAALGAVLSGVLYDNLIECAFALLVARVPTQPPPEDWTNPEFWMYVAQGLVVLSPLFATLLLGAFGALVGLYVACRWQSTPRATWLASYAFLWVGLFLGAGLILRYGYGEQPGMEKGHPLTRDLPLWPLWFFVLSGCYATLFRQPPLFAVVPPARR